MTKDFAAAEGVVGTAVPGSCASLVKRTRLLGLFSVAGSIVVLLLLIVVVVYCCCR